MVVERNITEEDFELLIEDGAPDSTNRKGPEGNAIDWTGNSCMCFDHAYIVKKGGKERKVEHSCDQTSTSI